MAKGLAQFSVEETDDGYLIRLEDEAGGVFEVTTTPEQLDDIADALDELLDEDDADDG